MGIQKLGFGFLVNQIQKEPGFVVKIQMNCKIGRLINRSTANGLLGYAKKKN